MVARPPQVLPATLRISLDRTWPYEPGRSAAELTRAVERRICEVLGGASPDEPTANTHLVLIPAFNPGRLLAADRRSAPRALGRCLGGRRREHGRQPREPGRHWRPGLRVIVRPENGGKGSAVLAGAREALAAGFTHALVMDADGQHPARSDPRFHGGLVGSARARSSAACRSSGRRRRAARLYGRKLSVGPCPHRDRGQGGGRPPLRVSGVSAGPLVRVLGSTAWRTAL